MAKATERTSPLHYGSKKRFSPKPVGAPRLPTLSGDRRSVLHPHSPAPAAPPASRRKIRLVSEGVNLAATASDGTGQSRPRPPSECAGPRERPVHKKRQIKTQAFYDDG